MYQLPLSCVMAGLAMLFAVYVIGSTWTPGDIEPIELLHLMNKYAPWAFVIAAAACGAGMTLAELMLGVSRVV
jgi:hypothetical protein